MQSWLILGVSAPATPSEIEAAWRRLRAEHADDPRAVAIVDRAYERLESELGRSATLLLADDGDPPADWNDLLYLRRLRARKRVTPDELAQILSVGRWR